MATIRRGTIVQETIDALKLQVGTNLPNETSDKFVLTYDFSNIRKLTLIKNQSKTTSGSQNIYTTSSSKQTFLTGACLHVVKDATCDVATGSAAKITASVGGESVDLLRIMLITTTAQDQILHINFEKPLRLDKNTTPVIATNTFTAGIMLRNATLYGYEVEE